MVLLCGKSFFLVSGVRRRNFSSIVQFFGFLSTFFRPLRETLEIKTAQVGQTDRDVLKSTEGTPFEILATRIAKDARLGTPPICKVLKVEIIPLHVTNKVINVK